MFKLLKDFEAFDVFFFIDRNLLELRDRALCPFGLLTCFLISGVAKVFFESLLAF